MRLICPNCGAQYEVPTEVIPENGRDVQCSDCSTTWFQHHPDHPPAEPKPEAALPAEDDSQEPPQSDQTDYGFDDGDDGWDEPQDDPEEEAEPASAPQAASRRGIDPQVADVLREEAEREARARQEDQRGGLETQQDLGLPDTSSDAARRSEQARARMARLRGEATDDDAPATTTPPEPERDMDTLDQGSRSNLLPDIDEINSSLRPDHSDHDAMPPPTTTDADAVAPAGVGGFRKGFRLSVILVILAVLLYVFAPQLAQQVPALADPLASYTDTLNGWRVALNELVQSFTGGSTPDTSGS